MKGIAEPVAVHLLTDRSAAQPITDLPPDVTMADVTIASSPRLTERATPLAMVERSAEATLLETAISAATHQIQVALVSGEPGVGKSTLVHQQVALYAACTIVVPCWSVRRERRRPLSANRGGASPSGRLSTDASPRQSCVVRHGVC
ncbi:MAG: hypothetical protein R2706_19795 [Acidimicrobiales bacterium]